MENILVVDNFTSLKINKAYVYNTDKTNKITNSKKNIKKSFK